MKKSTILSLLFSTAMLVCIQGKSDDNAGSEFTTPGGPQGYPPKEWVPLPCEGSLFEFFKNDSTLKDRSAADANATDSSGTGQKTLFKQDALGCSGLFGKCKLGYPNVAYDQYAKDSCVAEAKAGSSCADPQSKECNGALAKCAAIPSTTTDKPLTQQRGSRACQKTYDACLVTAGTNAIAKTACDKADTECKNTVQNSPEYSAKQTYSFVSYLNEMVIRQVIGTHLDLLYRFGVNASTLPGGADPSAGANPAGVAGATDSASTPQFDPRLVLTKDIWTDENPAAGACNLACGEVTTSRGVWDRSGDFGGAPNKFPASCGKEHSEDWSFRLNEEGLEACYDTDSGVWFDDSQPLMGSGALGRLMDAIDDDTDEDGDNDCYGIMEADHKRESLVANWERGAYAQLTWKETESILAQIRDSAGQNKAFWVEPECQTLAGSYLGQVKDGLAALGSQGACSLSLENLQCDPNNPVAGATTQRDCLIRALTTSLQGANFVQVVECSIYARVARKWQEKMDKQGEALKALRNRAIYACNQYWQGGARGGADAIAKAPVKFPDKEITWSAGPGGVDRCDIDETENGPACYQSNDNHTESSVDSDDHMKGLGTPSCFRRVYAHYYAAYMRSEKGLNAGSQGTSDGGSNPKTGTTYLQANGFPNSSFPGTSGLIQRFDVYTPQGTDGHVPNLIIEPLQAKPFEGKIEIPENIQYPQEYAKGCQLKDLSPKPLPTGPASNPSTGGQ